jgi:hypothetical protein
MQSMEDREQILRMEEREAMQSAEHRGREEMQRMEE